MAPRRKCSVAGPSQGSSKKTKTETSDISDFSPLPPISSDMNPDPEEPEESMAQQTPTVPEEAEQPGDQDNPRSFYSISHENPREAELCLTAYLGLPAAENLRAFAISWPVMNCLSRLDQCLPDLREMKPQVLAVYILNRRLIRKVASEYDYNSQIRFLWPTDIDTVIDQPVRSRQNEIAMVACRTYRMIQRAIWADPELSHPERKQRNEYARAEFTSHYGRKVPRLTAEVPTLRLRAAAAYQETDIEEFNRAFEVLVYMAESIGSQDLWGQRFGSIDAILLTSEPISEQHKPMWMRGSEPAWPSLRIPDHTY